jgi:hypothetical protein
VHKTHNTVIHRHFAVALRMSIVAPGEQLVLTLVK